MMVEDRTEHKHEILNAMDWGQWNRQPTKRGLRMMRKTILSIGGQFWVLWREKGGALKADGYTVVKYDNIWYLCQWRMPSGTETPQTEIAKEFEDKQRKAENWVPDDIDVPDYLKRKLLEYQPDSVKRIYRAIKKHGSALDGSDMGTGKTFVAIAVAIMLDLKIAVVCPLSVIPSWRRALGHFGAPCNMVINYESLRTGNTPYGKWEIVKGVRTFVFKLPMDSMIVLDEIQKTKNPSSLNNKMGTSAVRQGYKILGCSGTIASNPMEMKLSGQLAKLHDGAGFYAWMMRNGVEKCRFGFKYTGGPKILHKIRQHIYPEHGTRLRKDDLPGFPECDLQAEAYDCGEKTNEIVSTYDRMMSNIAEIEADGSRTQSERQASTMAEIQAARMAAERLKIPTIVEMCKDYVDEGNSVVVFTNYKETLSQICEMLNTECCVQGGQKIEVRQRNIDDFQEDKKRVIVVNIMSGGAGINLHDVNGKHPRIAIVCPSWSVFDMSQSLGRIHRAGAKSKAVQKIFFASGTIEEEVCNKVRQKLRNMSALNDADLQPTGIF